MAVHKKTKELMNQFAWNGQTNWHVVVEDEVVRESKEFKSWIRKHLTYVAEIDKLAAEALRVFIGGESDIWPKEKQTAGEMYYIKKDAALLALATLHRYLQYKNANDFAKDLVKVLS